MKWRICWLVLLVWMLAAGANAAEMVNDEYTDVTSVMTQDVVISLEADQDCSISILQPDEKAMALLEDMYQFVWEEKNRPVRYYDEETQLKIQALVPGVNIDILHLPEFMAQEMQGEPKEDVNAQRLLDVDYQPGQLVVVVLGIEEEGGSYRWYPYLAEVKETGLITYVIPPEDYKELANRQVIYHVLTDRIGARGGVIAHEETENERVVTPSKGAEDINRIRRWYTENGKEIKDPFRIFLVERTEKMEAEIKRIAEHIAKGQPAIRWFPEEMIREAKLLLDGKDENELIIYDIVAVMAENYHDTFGDVAAESVFASVYTPGSGMVVLLGFPRDGAAEAPWMDWYCLRAEALENETVEILFKQAVIPQMEEEPAMLLVLSQPIE